MLRIDRVLGSRSEREFAERIHALEHRGAVELLNVPVADLARRRLLMTTSAGEELAIALPREQKLFDGAVLLIDGERAIVVRAATERWLRLEPRSIGDAIELGYHAGNLHWRVRFEGEILFVALEGRPEDYVARLQELISSRRVVFSVLDEEAGQDPGRHGHGGHRHAMKTINTTTDTDDGGGAAGDVAGRRRFSERLLCIFLRYRGPAGLARQCRCRVAVRVDRGPAASALVDLRPGRAAAVVPCRRRHRRDSRRRSRCRNPRTFGASLREGSRRNGSAFLASHTRLGGTIAPRLRQAVRSGECLGHIVVMQGVVWRAMGLDEQLAQLTSGYCVASGAIAAAVRLGALGALEGQKVLAATLPLIDELVARPAPENVAFEKFSSVPGNRRGTP